MKARQRRFEWWHTLVTVLALNLCAYLGLIPLLHTVRLPEGGWARPVDEAGWLWVIVVLGVAGCIYLLKQLWDQGFLLLKQLTQKR